VPKTVVTSLTHGAAALATELQVDNIEGISVGDDLIIGEGATEQRNRVKSKKAETSGRRLGTKVPGVVELETPLKNAVSCKTTVVAHPHVVTTPMPPITETTTVAPRAVVTSLTVGAEAGATEMQFDNIEGINPGDDLMISGGAYPATNYKVVKVEPIGRRLGAKRANVPGKVTTDRPLKYPVQKGSSAVTRPAVAPKYTMTFLTQVIETAKEKATKIKVDDIAGINRGDRVIIAPGLENSQTNGVKSVEVEKTGRRLEAPNPCAPVAPNPCAPVAPKAKGPTPGWVSLDAPLEFDAFLGTWVLFKSAAPAPAPAPVNPCAPVPAPAPVNPCAPVKADITEEKQTSVKQRTSNMTLMVLGGIVSFSTVVFIGMIVRKRRTDRVTYKPLENPLSQNKPDDQDVEDPTNEHLLA
jgi:hypothetical protein